MGAWYGENVEAGMAMKRPYHPIHLTLGDLCKIAEELQKKRLDQRTRTKLEETMMVVSTILGNAGVVELLNQWVEELEETPRTFCPFPIR